MKIYSYFVCKVWNEDKKSFEIKKVKLSNEVTEHPGCYSQADEKNFIPIGVIAGKTLISYLKMR